jgi:LysM repeat protein
MNTALNAISNLKADDFVDTAMKFSTPPLTIQIPGAESSTLQLSPSRPDSSKYFVQMPNTQTTFVISKWTAQQLMKPIEQHVTVPGHTLATSKHQQEVPPPITPAGKKSATAKKMTETKPVAQTSPKTTPPKKQPAKTSQDTVSSPPVTTSLPVTSTKPTPKTKPGSQPLNVTPTQGTDEEEGDLSVHTVTSGETMTSIAKKYNVTVEQILKWNLLKSISVKPGQELYIYQKKK